MLSIKVSSDVFDDFKSMMIDAARAHAGLGKPPGKKQARENQGILWCVNAMFGYSVRREQLTGKQWDPDMLALKDALVEEGLQLPPLDPEGETIFPSLVRSALRRRIQGGYGSNVLQRRKDEAILWAGYRLSRLADEVDDLQ